MPGISFICDLEARLDEVDSLVLYSFDSIVHDDRYARNVLFKNGFYLLGYTSYKDYPITSFHTDEVAIYLEGQLYCGHHDVAQMKLTELAKLVFSPCSEAKEIITEFLLNCDGEFVVYILHKRTGDIAIINDVLGRLPLYCYRTNKQLILSRELRFITNLMDRLKFDKMAIAQYLLLGFPLGKKTLLEHVDRLEPATCIRISPKRARIQIDNLHLFNFEPKAGRHESFEENVRQIARLFSESCEVRCKPGAQNVISLSGGLDSRAVAACLYKLRIPYGAVTFLDHERIYASDAHVAGQLANLFNIEWKLFQLPPPKAEDVLKLLRIKNGMNTLGMSFLLPLFEKVRNSSNSEIIFITGDGGNHVLRDLRPPVILKNSEELVKYLILHKQIFSLETVTALTGIEKVDILGEYYRHIDSYPEDNYLQKYVHFLIYERAFKRQFEGEDRNRCYFWSTTPFWGIRFFKYAISAPEQQKEKLKLYREFLLSLFPAAAEVECARMGTPITTHKFRLALKAIAILDERPDVRRRVQAVVGPKRGYHRDSMVMQCIRQQMAACSPIFDYLAGSPLRSIIESSKHTREQIDHLFTIASAIEDLAIGKSVLEIYPRFSIA